MFASGQTLGRYRLEATLGRGGMAEVWRATDTRLGRTVAVKVIQPAYAAQPQFVERFLREARLVGGLEHPNILPVYDYGDADGTPYLVMPHLEGGTLAQRMDGTPIALAQVAPWVRQLAEALDFAHQAGVLHRDVKPANILIGKGDRPLLADFGIAKAAESATRLTATGVVVGTPVYMAPELALGKGASAQSDLYALAVLTFELLTGQPPFAGESALSLMHQHVQTPAPPPSTLLASLSPELDEVFREALAKEPHQRQRSCRAFADGLASSLSTGERDQVAEGVPGPWSSLAAQPTLHLVATRTPVTAVREPATTAMLAPPPPRRPWLAAAVLVAVALGVGGWMLGRAPKPAADGAVTATSAVAPPAAPSALPAANEPKGTDSSAPAKGPPAAPQSSTRTPPASSAPAPVEPSVPSAEPASTPGVQAAAATAPGEFRAGTGEERGGFGEGPALRQRLLDPARGLRRPSRGDFVALASAAQEALAARPEAAQARQVETFARGGEAYLDGQPEAARLALQSVLAPGAGEAAFLEASPLRFVRGASANGSALSGWHVAVGYGDPRREAAALLDRELATRPDDAALRLARAFVHHLDGGHETARALAQTVYASVPSPASARLLAEENQHLGKAEEALRWYRVAIDAAGRDAGPLSLLAAQLLARELQRPDEARRLLADACTRGDAPACRESERLGGDGAARKNPRQAPRPFGQRPILGSRRRPPGG